MQIFKAEMDFFFNRTVGNTALAAFCSREMQGFRLLKEPDVSCERHAGGSFSCLFLGNDIISV